MSRSANEYIHEKKHITADESFQEYPISKKTNVNLHHSREFSQSQRTLNINKISLVDLAKIQYSLEINSCVSVWFSEHSQIFIMDDVEQRMAKWQEVMEYSKQAEKVAEISMKFNKEIPEKIPERHYQIRARHNAHGSFLVFILCFVIVFIVSKLCKKCRSRPVITPLHESLSRNYYFDFFIFQTDWFFHFNLTEIFG